jgi:selenocysteine lyase/cysteine desulfurase
LSAGIDFVKRNPHLFSHKQRLLNLLLLELGKYPELKVFVSPDEESRLSIVSCTTATYGPQDLAMILDQHFNIAVRAGMHCAPRAHEFLGTAPLGTVRFSIGAFNTEHDIHKVGRALEQLFG